MKKILLFIFALFFIITIFPYKSNAETITKKYTTSVAEGFYFQGSMVLKDGKFYGTSLNGGSNGRGVIFEWDPDTNTYTKKYDFSLQNNEYGSSGSLTLKNGKFYGMMKFGGSNDSGVIFEWDPDTNIYTKKIDLSSSAGSRPDGNLVLKDGKFYGMTSTGGNNNLGVIFEWDPDTNIYTKKIDLNSDTGNTPLGSLTLKDGIFYGTTSFGGANGGGSIFEWNADTNIYTKKYDIYSNGSIGWGPKGNLVLKDGKFYGTTSSDDNNGNGTIFEWDPVENIYLDKYIIPSYYGGGAYLTGSLVLKDGKFYGMAPSGGYSENGTIFEWDPNTNIYTKKYDFSEGGDYPHDSLVLYNNMLYGITTKSIYEYDTTNFSPIASSVTFLGEMVIDNTLTGSYNYSDVDDDSEGTSTFQWYRDDVAIEGATELTYIVTLNDIGKRIKFEVTPVAQTGTSPGISVKSSAPIVSDVSISSGRFMGDSLIVSYNYSDVDDDFEGTSTFKWYRDNVAIEGAINSSYDSTTDDLGKIIKVGVTPVAQAGTSPGDEVLSEGLFIAVNPYTLIYNSTFTGNLPTGNLSIKDGKFYGMTPYGGLNDKGIIFEFDPTNSTYNIKHNFSGEDGERPQDSLVLKDGKFYGMTEIGGNNNRGVIFEWDPDTNTYIKKYDLSDSIGSRPNGNLALKDGKFYGTTSTGGDNNGVIFEWDPDTNIYTKKIDLNSDTGMTPFGSLTLKDGKFYGMAANGGDNNLGVIFEWDPNTSIYTKKHNFDGTDGAPTGDLSLNGGKFYGVTRYGGTNGNGSIFEWDPDTNTYIKKYDFGEIEGKYPNKILSLKNERFYGMTGGGGRTNQGVIFEWDPSIDTYTDKYDLSYQSNGSLVLYGDKFYGMIMDAIFEYNPPLYITIPIVVNSDVTNISSDSVKLNGNITSTGGGNPITRGFNYGLTINYSNTTIEDGSFSSGIYQKNITGLVCGTTYHFRSYATNTSGTGYSDDSTFITSNCPSRTSGSYIPKDMNNQITSVMTLTTPPTNPTSTPLLPPTNPTSNPLLPPTNLTSNPLLSITELITKIEKINKIIKPNTVSDDVKLIQVYLNTHGYPLTTEGLGSPGNETNKYGALTKKAIIKFQLANNLKPDGIVGPRTRGSMR